MVEIKCNICGGIIAFGPKCQKTDRFSMNIPERFGDESKDFCNDCGRRLLDIVEDLCNGGTYEPSNIGRTFN